MGRLQGAPHGHDRQADRAAADPARRLPVGRRRPRQELPDGLLLHRLAAAAEDAASLPRVHARGPSRARRDERDERSARAPGRVDRAAVPADLPRRVPRRRHHRRDDPAPAARRAVREPRQHRHHVELRARRPLSERAAPRAHPGGHRAAEGQARDRERRRADRLSAGDPAGGRALPHAARAGGRCSDDRGLRAPRRDQGRKPDPAGSSTARSAPGAAPAASSGSTFASSAAGRARRTTISSWRPSSTRCCSRACRRCRRGWRRKRAASPG